MPAADKSPRIAIVFHETYLGCAPSLINAARLFDEHGWEVDVVMRRSPDQFAQPPELGEHVEIFTVGKLGTVAQTISGSTTPVSQPMSWKSRLRAVLPQKIVPWLERARSRKDALVAGLRPAAWKARGQFVREVQQATQGRHYDAVIGVDMFGLAAAFAIAKERKVPLVYWSLEIMFLRDFWSPPMRKTKRLERLYHRHADVLVIQDHEREVALCNENDDLDCPTILIPNSPRGELAEGIARDHFHRQFGIDPATRVILHAGSICEGMRSSDLAASAANWPDDCVLIFHSHTPIDLETHYYRDIVASGNGRVLISTQPVAYDELDALVASADVGIVIYDSALGPNFQLLAGASGKLSHYLRCGVPVISIDNPSIARVLREHACGIGVDRVDDVTGAVNAILADHLTYQTRATMTYQTQFEFESHFQSLLTFLDTAIQSRTTATSSPPRN